METHVLATITVIALSAVCAASLLLFIIVSFRNKVKEDTNVRKRILANKREEYKKREVEIIQEPVPVRVPRQEIIQEPIPEPTPVPPPVQNVVIHEVIHHQEPTAPPPAVAPCHSEHSCGCRLERRNSWTEGHQCHNPCNHHCNRNDKDEYIVLKKKGAKVCRSRDDDYSEEDDCQHRRRRRVANAYPSLNAYDLAVPMQQMGLAQAGAYMVAKPMVTTVPVVAANNLQPAYTLVPQI